MDKTGGPAFFVPAHEDHRGWIIEQHPGMTLRDYFAAQVLPALLSREHSSFADDVSDAYLIAKIMIEQSNK